MKFLIQTLDGETIEADLLDAGNSFPDDDVMYVDGVPCKLSTARSLEAEAVKEAEELFRDVLERYAIPDVGESVEAWLAKWERD